MVLCFKFSSTLSMPYLALCLLLQFSIIILSTTSSWPFAHLLFFRLLSSFICSADSSFVCFRNSYNPFAIIHVRRFHKKEEDMLLVKCLTSTFPFLFLLHIIMSIHYPLLYLSHIVISFHTVISFHPLW